MRLRVFLTSCPPKSRIEEESCPTGWLDPVLRFPPGSGILGPGAGDSRALTL
jgi:hypothetical protein